MMVDSSVWRALELQHNRGALKALDLPHSRYVVANETVCRTHITRPQKVNAEHLHTWRDTLRSGQC